MKKYTVTTKHIRDSDLSSDFVNDMMYCEDNNIPINYRKQKYSGRDVRITRCDLLQFPSGQPSWNHNLEKYPVIGYPFIEDHFGNEELFHV